MDTLLTIFIAVTAAAVVLQMIILAGMFLTMRKLATRVEALADKVEDTTGVVQARVLPLLENAKSIQEQVKGFVEKSRPQVETLIGNVTEIRTTDRSSA